MATKKCKYCEAVIETPKICCDVCRVQKHAERREGAKLETLARRQASAAAHAAGVHQPTRAEREAERMDAIVMRAWMCGDAYERAIISALNPGMVFA